MTVSVPQVPNLGQVPRLPRGAVAKQLLSWEHETLLVVLRTMNLASCPVLGQGCASERAAQLNRERAIKGWERHNSRNWAAGLYNHMLNPVLLVCPNPVWCLLWGWGKD